jgi:hypothetical protein
MYPVDPAGEMVTVPVAPFTEVTMFRAEMLPPNVAPAETNKFAAVIPPPKIVRALKVFVPVNV